MFTELAVDLFFILLPTALFWLMLRNLPWVAKELGLVIVSGEVLRGRENRDGSYDIVMRLGSAYQIVNTHVCTFCHYMVLPAYGCRCNKRTFRPAFLSQRASVLS
jgi:hypothetical protein